MDLGRLAPVSEVAGSRIYHAILKLADHALFKIVRYVLFALTTMYVKQCDCLKPCLCTTTFVWTTGQV
jgi:hypothetical protein